MYFFTQNFTSRNPLYIDILIYVQEYVLNSSYVQEYVLNSSHSTIYNCNKL